MTIETRPEPPIVPLRLGTVPPNEMARVHDPYDPVDPDWSRWFDDAEKAHDGNEVIPYLDARKLFPDMASAIRSAKGPGHSIFFAAWSVHLELQLVPGDASSELRHLLRAAAQRGVEVFVLLNHFSTQVGAFRAFDNKADAASLGSIPSVASIHDDRLLVRSFLLVKEPVQAHHQKLLIVSGDDGLVAFAGGVDVEPNRLDFLHDLHVRIRGSGALDLHRVFLERWGDHRTSRTPPAPAPSSGHGPKLDNRVRVARTYPNAPAHGGLKGDPSATYAFAPRGERTVESAIVHAIRQARKFIYVEDQYLVNTALAAEIARVAPRLQFVLCLVCSDALIDNELQGQAGWRRQEFLRIARSTGGRILAYASQHNFVHSKVWIVDDRCAIVGSANVNRRGMTHDSEVACTIVDVNPQRRWFFAHELRMNLWARQTGAPPIVHKDAFAATNQWDSPVARTRVEKYVPAAPRRADQPPGSRGGPPQPPDDAGQRLWDGIIDPDGS